MSARLLQPLQSFLQLEAAGGLILMAAAALALIVANSPLAVYYAALLDVPVGIRIGGAGIAKRLLLWINDGLMAVFFFLIGMELKREVLEGHLSRLRQASLPAIAAAGDAGAGRLLRGVQLDRPRCDEGLGDPDRDRHRLRPGSSLAAFRAVGLPPASRHRQSRTLGGAAGLAAARLLRARIRATLRPSRLFGPAPFAIAPHARPVSTDLAKPGRRAASGV